MSFWKKDTKAEVTEDISVGSAADVEAVMKKYDRESNTRLWEGTPKLVIRVLMAMFSLYCIIDTVFLSTKQEVRLPVFVGLILLFGFLLFPAKKGDNRVNYLPWYDVVLLIAGPGAYFFYAVNADEVIRMSARVMQNDLYMIVGLIGVLALIELCRRCVGLPILCVAGVLLVYTFFNLMGGAPLGIEQIRLAFYQVIRTMFYTFNGIFGGPINVCAKFIVVFIIFGRGTVATGRVERGVLNLNEKVEIVGLSDEKRETTVTGIEMFHKLLDYAEAGDNIGALLRGVAKTEIERGQVLSKPGSIHPHTKFVGQVYVLTKDEGGRHTPFFNNYRPQFYFRTTDVTGIISLPEGTEMCMPGDNVDMNVELITPIAIEKGLRFAIREGGRTVGSGVVIDIEE